VYTKIDLCEAYNLVNISEGDEWNTTFRTRYGHFEYVLTSFGLTNTLVVVQHLMNNVYHEYLDDFVVLYKNDIIIFSKNVEDHECHVCLSFKKLNFMPNWISVNSINLKWNSWVTSSLEMAFACIIIRFTPLLIGLL
jgi:hypothetical protein